MKRNIVLILFCAVFLLTLVIIPGTSVQAAGVAVYDKATFCNVPAANPGDPSYSEMAAEQNTYGFGCQHKNGTLLAETFTLNAEATIKSVELFAYQKGSDTTPTFTGAYLMIYDGKPGEGGKIIWGDEGTDLFASASFTGCYRVLSGSKLQDRPIMKIVADISKGSNPVLKLAAGTYWLAFSLVGSLDSGPWGVPNILDTPYTPGTAIQRYNGNWTTIHDSDTNVQASIPLRLLADGKQPQTPPAAPVVSELTDTSVTLEVMAGAEYRLNDGAWQTDPKFTGLTPNTTYNLYARLAETSTHQASPESPATAATTLKSAQTAPAAPVVSELTDTSVTLEVMAGAEYRLNDGAWQTDPKFTGLTPNTTYNLYARLAETATHQASPESPATAATTLKSTQTAPDKTDPTEIEVTQPKDIIPKTGEDSGQYPWLALLLISISGLIFMLVYRDKIIPKQRD